MIPFEPLTTVALVVVTGPHQMTQFIKHTQFNLKFGNTLRTTHIISAP